MSHSINTPHGDILRGLNNADETHKPKSTIILKEMIEGTPFTHIETEDDKFIAMGNYRLSPNLNDTGMERHTWIEINKWNLILQIVSIAIEKLSTIEKPETPE